MTAEEIRNLQPRKTSYAGFDRYTTGELDHTEFKEMLLQELVAQLADLNNNLLWLQDRQEAVGK